MTMSNRGRRRPLCDVLISRFGAVNTARSTALRRATFVCKMIGLVRDYFDFFQGEQGLFFMSSQGIFLAFFRGYFDGMISMN